MLRILAEVQAAYGYVPIAALKRISEATGAWYATAVRDRHLLPTTWRSARRSRATATTADATFLAALDGALDGRPSSGADRGTEAHGG